MEIVIDVLRNPFGRSVDLYIYSVPRMDMKSDAGSRPAMMQTPVFETMTDEMLGTQREPQLRLSPENAQYLMDALWNAGVRPSEETSAGQLQAMQAHLSDLRKLVFEELLPTFKPLRGV